MRQYGPQSPRNIPVDRNPTTIVNGGGIGGPFAGGVNTILATYTVPVGRRAFVAQAMLYGNVAVALAAGQQVTLTINITPSGGAATVAAQDMIQGGSAAGVSGHAALPGFYLKALDLVEVRAIVGAGVGTCNAGGGLDVTEYDA